MYIWSISEVTDENGQLVRTCEGDLAVNKCEGTCTSQLQPSVVKASGFLKVSLGYLVR